MKKPYGCELILDLHECNPATFNRASLDLFFTQLCKLIEMEKCEVHFWDDVGVPLEECQTDPHTKGTSAVCFILTSSIVVHTLDDLRSVYVNIFSCKDFSYTDAEAFSKNWFESKSCISSSVNRTGGSYCIYLNLSYL